MPDPRSEEFWNERYRTGKTPWDYGGVPPEFQEYIERNPNLSRILIPGCGSGYELRAAHDAGIEAIGIELSSEAASRARTISDRGSNVLTGDFFSHPFSDGGFDGVYERTFLCAISPQQRPDYVRRMDALLRPAGVLFGFFLYGEESDPPPYPLREGEEKELLEPLFDLLESSPSRSTLPLFAGMERWQVWRKKN